MIENNCMKCGFIDPEFWIEYYDDPGCRIPICKRCLPKESLDEAITGPIATIDDLEED